MKIFILAGGFGTRLNSVVKDVPKPLAPINDIPFLDYQILQIRKYLPNIKIHLLTHYKSAVIEKYYKKDIDILVIKEDIPLGTGGSILNAINSISMPKNEQLLVLNGDTYLEVDFIKFIDSSKEKVNILSAYQEDCSRYGTLEIKNDIILSFKEKVKNCRNNYINAGCYFFKDLNFFCNDKILNKVFSLEEEFIKYLKENKIGTYKYDGIFIDIGVPIDYEKMKKYIGNNNE